ncbi:MAG: hypothetical protein M9915_11675 [Rhizobacter sp.]|nr:hypothetical protein [Rhizobacter sp.]
MNAVHPSQPQNCTPFVPVLKADAAALLRVCAKTIDNYIAQGLLPKPTRFGMREMWHPNVFYAHLSRALLGEGLLADDVISSAPVEATAAKSVPPVAPKLQGSMPIGAGRLSQRLAEINQRHSA